MRRPDMQLPKPSMVPPGAEPAATSGQVTLDIRVRLAIVVTTAALLCSYALLWNLSVVHYYSMLSDPQKLAEQLVAPRGRILWHVLLLPCLASLYFAATSTAATTGGATWIALKQLGLLLIFAALVQPLLMLASYLTGAGDMACLKTGTCPYLPSLYDWVSAALNYSPIYALGLFLIFGLVMFAKYRQEQLQAAALRADWLQARLEALRANLHPHFLFNTLNTISSLVGSRPEEARDVIAGLAALLRDSIREADSEFCLLGREYDLAEKYLRIICVRFGERFRPALDVPESLKDRSVPRGLLLTLIENGVTHGIAALAGDCTLSVRCMSREGALVVEARNRCQPGPPESRRRGGLVALDSRLQALYGNAYRLEYGPDDAGSWCTRVTLPAEDAATESAPPLKSERAAADALSRGVPT